jgi:hypothetical protein
MAREQKNRKRHHLAETVRGDGHPAFGHQSLAPLRNSRTCVCGCREDLHQVDGRCVNHSRCLEFKADSSEGAPSAEVTIIDYSAFEAEVR